MISIFLSVALLMTSGFNSLNGKINEKVLLASRVNPIKDGRDKINFDSTILYTGWYYVIR
jgi:hypothetical protein